MSLSERLIQAYRQTDYRVLTTPPLTLIIDRVSPGLARLMASSGVATAAVITAWNPRSQPTAEAVNRLADVQLRKRLESLHAVLYPVCSEAWRGDWPVEPSWLAMGLDRRVACELGHEFGQNALVWADQDACPQLMLLPAD